MRRYPVVGGMAAWRLPLLASLLALAGVALDAGGWALGVLGFGWLANRLWQCVVVEVSPDGLARGLLVEGTFLRPPAAIAWSAVVAVETDWCDPGDHSGLETRVRGRDGTTIRLSTAMGCRGYWSCLEAIVRRAPGAARSGLTDATLAGGPPARREVLAAAKTSAVLALVLVALIGVFYVWAQGRSSLARDLERATEAGSFPPGECGGAVERSEPGTADGWPAPPCPPPAGEPRTAPP
jgi:hypothetical protein